MARTIILAHDVSVPAADIYLAITTQDGLAAFWTSDVSAEPEVGAELRLGFAEAPVDLQMVVVALEPDRRVVWECRGPWPYWTDTEVEWRIISGDGGTHRVLFRHSGWPDEQPEEDFGSVAMVWGLVLLALDNHLTTGEVAPALG